MRTLGRSCEPHEEGSPWIGAGIGWEILSIGVEADLGESSATFSGLEFFHVQGGYDFLVADNSLVGPYGLFSLGQYSSSSFTTEVAGVEVSSDEDIDDKGIHGWFQVGVKGTIGAL